MAVLTYSHMPVTRSELPWAVRQGAIGGIVAGAVFALFEVIASAAIMGLEAAVMPLRMIGAIALGSVALEAGYPLASAILAALLVHIVLAVIYGGLFGIFAGGLRGGPAIIGLGTAYGTALWLLNFYIIAPAAFPWFAEADPTVQFVGHAFFFGSVLGLYVWRAHERLLRSPVP